jgi:CubicO group peptidase (beta-lactamase class C family)
VSRIYCYRQAIGKAIIYLLVLFSFGCSAKDTNYSYAYTHDGVLEYYNDSETGITEKSIFEIGSIGKVIAAYICMELMREGRLDIDAPVSAYLDKKWITSDERFTGISTTKLLSHTAGFSPSYEFGIDKHIYFEPGSMFSYSGVGYMYIQKIIENITGEDFEKAARRYVFDPLGMFDSTFLNKKTVKSGASPVVYLLAKLLQKEPNCAYSLKSTAYDMALFAEELLRCYKETPFEKMFASEIAIDIHTGWGLGLAIEQTGNTTTYWHSGINPGFQSLMVLEPQTQSALVVLTNSDTGLSYAREIIHKTLNLDGTWDIPRTRLK